MSLLAFPAPFVGGIMLLMDAVLHWRSRIHLRVSMLFVRADGPPAPSSALEPGHRPTHSREGHGYGGRTIRGPFFTPGGNP